MKMRFLRTLFLLAAVAPIYLHAQEMKVLVLDASSGNPQSGVKIQYFCTSPSLNSPNSAPVFTKSSGYANVPITCNDNEKVELIVLPPDPKEQCGELPPLSIKEISSTGVLANPGAAGNIWCSDKIRKKMKPTPGQITLFVKRPTWFQSHF